MIAGEASMMRRLVMATLGLAMVAVSAPPAQAIQLYWAGNYYDTAAACLADAQHAVTTFPGMGDVESSQYEYRGGYATNTAAGSIETYIVIACIPYTNDNAGAVISMIMVAVEERPEDGIDAQAIRDRLQPLMDPSK
jgi:hypothetical protein